MWCPLLLLLGVAVVFGEQEFEGRKVLIVGSSGGMGRSAADLVYERGGKITYSSRSEGRLQKIIEDKDKDRAFALKCDAGDPEMVKATVDRAAELMGGLDGIVWIPTFFSQDLNPMVSSVHGADGFYSLLEGHFKYDVEYFARFIEAAIPHLQKEEKASVVGISSICASIDTGLAPYSVMKAAHEALVRSLAIQYAPKIRINTFRAGAYATEIFSNLGEDAFNFVQSQLSWRAPMQRFGTAGEAGEAIAFLLSDRSGYMTGQPLHADGGVTLINILQDVWSSPQKIQPFTPPADPASCDNE